MNQWEARLIRIIGPNVDPAGHPWPVSNESMSAHQRGQPSIGKDDLTPARDVSSRPCHQDAAAVHGSSDFAVEGQGADDAVIVALAGEFDLAAAASVRATLTRAIS